MPLPTRLSSYPADYIILFRKALSEGSIKVELETEKKARALRLELIGFRAALRLDPSADPELAQLADGLTIVIDGRNCVLRLRELKFGDAIQKALQKDVL